MQFISLLLTIPAVSAHFVLNYPPSLGFNDDTESTSPCGGEAVKFSSNDQQVQVDGFAIALQSTHPSADFLYRGTLDQKEPFNWTNFVNVASENGIGDFCLPQVKAPAEWAGKQGLIQVQQKGPDGLLYQCAAVNFVQGKSSSAPSNCKNATGLTASITSQTDFGGSNSTNASTSASATKSGTAATATKSGLAARATGGVFLTGLGLLAAGVVAL